MSPVAIMFIAFGVLLFIGVPIAFSIGMPVVLYLSMTGMFSPTYIPATLYTATDSFPLMAIPLFTLAGALMQGGGLAKRLVKIGDALVGHLTGGLAICTVVCCMFFGALSGSSAATIVSIGSIMIPEMRARGYSKGFCYALITAAGCLGVLIPPSIPMVLLGTACSFSISTLFIGGIGSGLVVGGLLIIYSVFVCHKRGWRGNGKKFSIKAVGKSLLEGIWALFVPVIILGGIYGGYFTPTEAACIACFYALVAGKLIYKELSFEKLMESLTAACVTTVQALIILGTATCLARMMTIENIPNAIQAAVQAATDSRVVVLLMMNVILLICGCIMDAAPIMTVIGPLFWPIARAYGVDPIHFGVMFVTNITIGFITPPVGLNIFVAVGMGDCSLKELIKPLVPFFVVMAIAMCIVTYCPQVVLFIPRLLGYAG